MGLFSKDVLKSDESVSGAMPTTPADVPPSAGADSSDTAQSPDTVAQSAPVDQSPETIDTSAPIAREVPVESGEQLEPQKRKRGRPSNAEIAARLNGVTPPPPKPAPVLAPQAAAQKLVDYETLGQTAANLWFNVGHLALGDDWIPAPQEVMPVKNAFRDYFKTTNITEIPPAWNLVLVLGGYTLARLQKPTVKTRFNLALSWVKTKFKR